MFEISAKQWNNLDMDPSSPKEKDLFDQIAREEGFRDVHTEPQLAAIFFEIREFNQRLVAGEVDIDELRETVQSFNEQCWLLCGTDIAATGRITFMNIDGRSGQAVTKGFYDLLAVFNNFDVVNEAGSDEISDCQVVYSLTSPIEWMGDSGDGREMPKEVTGYAKIDEVIMDFDCISSEKAKMWLQYYHPQLLNIIDEKLFSPDHNESHTTMRFADLQIDMNDLGIAPGSPDEEKVLNHIVAYLNAELDYDEQMPYTVHFNGAFLRFDETRNRWIPDQDNKIELCQIKKIFLQAASSNADGIYDFHLELNVLTPARNAYGPHVRVPIKELSGIQSTRTQFYDSL